MEQLFEGPHQHPAGWSSNSDWMFKYMPLGKMLISSLVTELGLDPETTKPEDLDKLDWRFTCRQCEQVAGHLGAPIHVYSWRPAVRLSCSRLFWITVLICLLRSLRTFLRPLVTARAVEGRVRCRPLLEACSS